MRREEITGPQVLVEQVSRSPRPASRSWLVVWNIRNMGQELLQIIAGRLPHSQFRAEERNMRPGLVVLPGQTARFEFEVACDEVSGTVVENAFLILRVQWLSESWRILARLRVIFDEEGGPQTTTERVTAQRIGFSIAKTQSE
ncbi:MAG: hypothetical protein ACRD1T_15410 [Acidimicrobiia bacterium]